ncbi:MAG TPA: hypothetical protein VMT03_23785 [Polyangia bacterium]|nr:hypothetical protein [Polyangia bacterium]
MTARGALLVLVVAGCGGGGGAAPPGESGQRRGDGGSDATSDVGAPSGDGAAPTCGNVQPCGGDVVGNWTFVEECESATSVATIQADFARSVDDTWCALAQLIGIEPQASGSLQFDAAGHYALELIYSGTFDIEYPVSCLVAFDCDDLTAELQSEIDAGVFPVPSASSVSCVGTSSCLCRAAVSAEQSQSGTYSVAGSVMTLISTNGAVLNKSYCIAGNAFHVLATSTGTSGQTSIDSDVVAVKQ